MAFPHGGRGGSRTARATWTAWATWRAAAALAVGVITLAVAGPGRAAADPTYDGKCAFCHQTGAKGLPGQFPRLAGRVAAIATRPEGRHYLLTVVLNGMSGTITVDGTPLTGLMPSFAATPDDALAKVLTYLTAQEPAGAKPAPFTAAEVAAVRAEARIPGSQVRALRQDLATAGVVP